MGLDWATDGIGALEQEASRVFYNLGDCDSDSRSCGQELDGRTGERSVGGTDDSLGEHDS